MFAQKCGSSWGNIDRIKIYVLDEYVYQTRLRLVQVFRKMWLLGNNTSVSTRDDMRGWWGRWKTTNDDGERETSRLLFCFSGTGAENMYAAGRVWICMGLRNRGELRIQGSLIVILLRAALYNYSSMLLAAILEQLFGAEMFGMQKVLRSGPTVIDCNSKRQALKKKQISAPALCEGAIWLDMKSLNKSWILMEWKKRVRTSLISRDLLGQADYQDDVWGVKRTVYRCRYLDVNIFHTFLHPPHQHHK